MTSTRIGLALGSLTAVTLAAASCSSYSPEDACNDECACEGCNSEAMQECVASAEDTYSTAKKSGCQSQADQYLSCLHGEAKCVLGFYDTNACEVEYNAGTKCLADFQTSSDGGSQPATAAADAGSPPARQPVCDVSQPVPSGGSCMAVAGSIRCNLVSNAECKADALVCGLTYADRVDDSQCYSMSDPGSLCTDCRTGLCGAGLICASSHGFPGTSQCAQACCADGDCGANGVCVKAGASFGVCLSK